MFSSHLVHSRFGWQLKMVRHKMKTGTAAPGSLLSLPFFAPLMEKPKGTKEIMRAIDRPAPRFAHSLRFVLILSHLMLTTTGRRLVVRRSRQDKAPEKRSKKKPTIVPSSSSSSRVGSKVLEAEPVEEDKSNRHGNGKRQEQHIVAILRHRIQPSDASQGQQLRQHGTVHVAARNQEEKHKI